MILINTKFSRWTVIGNRERLDKNGHRRYRYLCLCDCGVQKYVFRSDLTQGKSKSCGCLRKDNLHQTIIHGQARKNSHSRTYNIWANMLRRCYDTNRKDYCHYGGRGISVCNDWLIFENFLDDMGYAPDKHQLDRIDNNGNYEPGNCRWASIYIQHRNKRSNNLLSFIGITMPMVSWSEFLLIPYYVLLGRIKRGWAIERAFELIGRC